jgi:protein-L-isoaspartate(D-aspartate) O-methyltransferase
MSLNTEHFEKLRQHMVAEITAETIFVSARIGKAALGARAMEAIGKVPRHEFVPAELQPYAYANVPLPIGCDKTISQALHRGADDRHARPRRGGRVLEIGTGLGYRAAILAELARKVYSVEIIEELAEQARLRLGRQRYKNIEFKVGNGYYGWPSTRLRQDHGHCGARSHSGRPAPAAEGRRQDGDP